MASCQYLFRLVFVDVVLLVYFGQVAPHLRNQLSNLPQLQFGIARFHVVPYFAIVTHERHEGLLWGLRWLWNSRIRLQK